MLVGRRVLAATARGSRTRMGSREAGARLRGEYVEPAPQPAAVHAHQPWAGGIQAGYNAMHPGGPYQSHASAEEQRAATRELLSHPQLIIARQMEWLNVFAGYEQANKYAILGAQGQVRYYSMPVPPC